LIVNCNSIVCINNKNGICISESIEIVDIEEKENIKMKDNDFSVCKTFKGEY
jgi:hypothetical protein